MDGHSWEIDKVDLRTMTPGDVSCKLSESVKTPDPGNIDTKLESECVIDIDL